MGARQHGEILRRLGGRHASDLWDDERAVLEPLIRAGHTAAPRGDADIRELMNAVFDLARDDIRAR